MLDSAGEMREDDSRLSVRIICLVTITVCCVYAGPSTYESAQFWLWLVLVLFVIVAVMSFSVIFLPAIFYNLS